MESCGVGKSELRYGLGNRISLHSPDTQQRITQNCSANYRRKSKICFIPTRRRSRGKLPGASTPSNRFKLGRFTLQQLRRNAKGPRSGAFFVLVLRLRSASACAATAPVFAFGFWIHEEDYQKLHHRHGREEYKRRCGASSWLPQSGTFARSPRPLPSGLRCRRPGPWSAPRLEILRRYKPI